MRARDQALLLALCFACGERAQAASAVRAQWLMGTVCEITAYGPGARQAESAAFAEIARWDRVLSLYNKESELSILNRVAAEKPFSCSQAMWEALDLAMGLAQASGGAFDVTILPVLKNGASALSLVGSGGLALDRQRRSVMFKRAGMGLDFGGIGKGLALDHAASVLRRHGATAAMINFGGQILAFGAPPGSEGWSVKVPGQESEFIIGDASISTSGNEEKPGHIASPFTGRPVAGGAGVTVIAPTGAEADAWSTALFVLGKTAKDFPHCALRPATPPGPACRRYLKAAAHASAQPRDNISQLERKLDLLSQEIERLKLEGAGSSGRGAWLSHFSIAGYAEVNARFFARRNQKGDGAGLRNTTDLERFVLVPEYRFTDSIIFKSELEFEHAATGEGDETRGEAGLEQATLDFLIKDTLNFRAGHILLPVGLINETHEPPTFHGVMRPSVETFIIPTTWHENGLGLFGRWGPLTYRSYVTAGLQAVKGPAGGGPSVAGFTGSNGIRGASSEGSNSPSDDLAWVSRVDLNPIPGLLLGASLYTGGADQNLAAASVPVTLWETHGAFDYNGAELRALYARSTIGNADAVNAAQAASDPAFNDFVGRRQFGGYAQAAFNVLSLRAKPGQYLAPFLRYERFDTQSQVPAAFSNNAANSRVEFTVGLTYKPIPQVALKSDYQWKRNQARTGVNQFNLGMGLMF